MYLNLLYPKCFRKWCFFWLENLFLFNFLKRINTSKVASAELVDIAFFVD